MWDLLIKFDLCQPIPYMGKHFEKARQDTGRFRAVETVHQVYKQANTNNMESQWEEYIIPNSHAPCTDLSDTTGEAVGKCMYTGAC
jgi:hypothetical protein